MLFVISTSEISVQLPLVKVQRKVLSPRFKTVTPEFAAFASAKFAFPVCTVHAPVVPASKVAFRVAVASQLLGCAVPA